MTEVASVGQRARELALRLVVLVGLASSALLLVGYLAGGTALCSEGGGCDEVRRWAGRFAVGIPAAGLAFYAGIALLLLVGGRARRWLLPASLVGALVAVGLFGLQAFVIGAFCRTCLFADGAGLALLALALAQRSLPAPPWSAAGPVLFGASALLCAVGPLVAGAGAGANAPGAAEIALTQAPEILALERPDVATIVEYLDYECPYCCRLAHVLDEILAPYAARVRIVRKNVPMQSHASAEHLSRVACCAEEVGRGEEIAAALMAVRTGGENACDQRDLSPAASVRLWTEHGLDLATLTECVTAPRTSDRIAADQAHARAVGVHGLPTYFIGRERFEGLEDASVLRASVARAVARLR